MLERICIEFVSGDVGATKMAVATEATDTLPIDIMAVTPPSSIKRKSPSPEVPAEERRAAYQGIRRQAPTEPRYNPYPAETVDPAARSSDEPPFTPDKDRHDNGNAT